METIATKIAVQVEMFGQLVDEFRAAVERQVGDGKRFATSYQFAIYLLQEGYELLDNDEQDGARWALNKAAMLVDDAERATTRDGRLTDDGREALSLIAMAVDTLADGRTLTALDSILEGKEVVSRIAAFRSGS